MQKLSKSLVFWSVMAAAAGSIGAFKIVGWIGVAILGLLIAFIAFQADMDDAAPIGGQQTSSLYASTIQAQTREGQADKAARHAQRTASLRVLDMSKIIGGVLALIGLLGFFFLQLPH